MSRAQYGRALRGSTSLIVVAMALATSRQAAAQDTTIANSITTGASWDGTTSPGSNFTITPTGVISTSDPYGVTVVGTAGAVLGTFLNGGLVVGSSLTGSAINVGTVTINQFTNATGATISAASRGVLVGSTGTIGALTNSGRIAGDQAVQNDGSIGSINNSGTLFGSDRGIYQTSTGQIGTIVNDGVIAAGTTGPNAAGGIANGGLILSIVNNGTILSSHSSGIGNNLTSSSIGTLVNNGLISGVTSGIYSQGTFTQITNTGQITGPKAGIWNQGGVITNLNNSGTISGGTKAINLSGGSIGALTNSGLISGPVAFSIGAGASLTSIANSGVIAGSIVNSSANALTISGGSGATIGTLTGSTLTNQGSIVNTASNLVFSGGNLLLNDNINATGRTVSNTGATLFLNSRVNVAGAFSQTAGSLVIDPMTGGLIVSGAADVTGGTVTSTFASTGNYTAGTYTLVSGSSLNLTGATTNINSLTGLSRSTSTVGNQLLLTVQNDYVGGTQASISNSGTISGVNYPLYVANTGSIGTFVNSGSLIGSLNGASNNGSIGSFTNSGLIQGSEKGLGNQSTITEFTNSASGTIRGGTAAGFQNDTSMGTLTNAGLISSGSAAVANYGTLGMISNSGSISGGPQGIYLDGNSTVTSIVNSGTITAPQTGIQVSGMLTALTNSGFIGGNNAVNVAGTLSALANLAGGTIRGDNAIYISGSLGGLTNSGVIAGAIRNETATALTITGGSGATIGTLTGVNLSSRGSIVNTLSNLTFAGNLLVNDNINVGSNTLTNAGGSLSFNSIVTVTGKFAQSTGSLSMGTTGKLVVTQVANISGGTIIAAGLSSTSTYRYGSTAGTLVQGGAGSSYSGYTLSVGGGLTGLAAVGTTSGNNLLVQMSNDYIGSTQGALTNSDTISEVGTALYVAATGSATSYANSGGLLGLTTAAINYGSIGVLSNTGTISGAAAGFANMSGATIGTLANMGTMLGGIGNFGIVNTAGVINTLINGQGGGSNAPLTYSGALPDTYLQYVYSLTQYGQMQVTGGTGTINDFDIADGSTLSFGTTYTSVLSGVGTIEGQTSATSGSFSSGLDHYDWDLVNVGSNVWDLVVSALITAPDAEDTVSVGQPAVAASFAQQFDNFVILSQLSNMRVASAPAPQDQGSGNPALQVSSMGAPATQNFGFAIQRGAKANSTTAGGAEVSDLSSSGLTLGVGRQLDNVASNVGLFLSVSHGSSTALTSSSTVDTQGIGVFGDRDLGGGFLLEGYLAYYRNANEVSRLSGGDLYTASPDGEAITGFARVSYSGLTMPEQMMLTPYVEMSYVRQSTDGYDESGTGGAAIHVDADSSSNVNTAVGAVMAAQLPLGNGMTLSPTLDAAWVHAANSGARSLSTSFVGGTDVFDAALPGTDQNYGRIKASIDLQVNESFNLSVGYSTQVANDDLKDLGEARIEASLKF